MSRKGRRSPYVSRHARDTDLLSRSRPERSASLGAETLGHITPGEEIPQKWADIELSYSILERLLSERIKRDQEYITGEFSNARKQLRLKER